jgi:hypothetical protein
MNNILKRWLSYKWSRPDPTLLQAYHATFSAFDGQRVLNHLLDNVYFKVYEGTDVQGAVIHNARRSVVQDILETLDAAEHPTKHMVQIERQESLNGT